MNIYIANLNFDLQNEELTELFTSYGEVSSANIIKDKMTGQSRGFGFVEMSDDTAAKKAIAELDGTMVNGRAIKVNEAKPRAEGGFGGGQRSGEKSFNSSRSYNQNRY